MFNYGLFIENIGTKPTFTAARETGMIETTIDVTLSARLNQRLTNWRVMEDYNGSDHRTIRFEMPEVKTRKEKVRLWDKTNWALFEEMMGKYKLYHPVNVNEKKIDKMVECLYLVLNKALDVASPKVVVKLKNKDFYWYSDEHREIKKKVNKLYIRWMRTRKPSDRIAYKKEQRVYKKKCKKDKRNEWHRYIDGISSAKDITKLNRILNNNDRNVVSVFDIPDRNGSTTEVGEETLNELLKTHFPKAVPVSTGSTQQQRQPRERK